MYINKWKYSGTLIFSVLLLLMMGCGGDDNPTTDYQLTWEDNFDGPTNISPDDSKWQFDIGTDWGNQQLEFDTDRTKNVAYDGEGNLAITAHRENYNGSTFTSGRISTEGLFSQKYGRFEARIKLPTGAGLWPAFWMLGDNFRSVGWPNCGEIDIMEYRGQEPSIVHGSVHGPNYSAGNAVTKKFSYSNDRFDNGFHIFRIDWSADEIKYYVDDNLYQTIKKEDLPGEWVFDHDFFIILNLAVGGSYVGPPNASTIFPQTMLVDYVKVYKAVE